MAAHDTSPDGNSPLSAPFIPDNSLLNSLLHSRPLNAYAKDGEGRFIFSNSLHCRNIGKTETEILGKTDYDIHPEILAQKIRSLLDRNG